MVTTKDNLKIQNSGSRFGFTIKSAQPFWPKYSADGLAWMVCKSTPPPTIFDKYSWVISSFILG